METAINYSNGDRVIYKPGEGHLPVKGGVGKKATIVDVENGLIQFDKNVGGHEGSAGLPSGTGWYVNLERDVVPVKRGRPIKKEADKYDEVLSEIAKSLKALEQVDIDELVAEIKARSESRKVKSEAEQYFDFGDSHELGMSTCEGPLYIRYGLADPYFEGRELGFNTADYEIRINDLVIPTGAVLRAKKK